MRPGQRSVTVLMLVVCAAVGVAIAGFPHRGGEPAIRLSDSAGASGTEPSTTDLLDVTTTSVDPTTTTAPSTSTSTTRLPVTAPTATTKPHRPATEAKPAAATSTTAATLLVKTTSTTTVRPTGLNPGGR